MTPTNFQSWLKKTCPNFYKQTLLHNGDYELILEFACIREFDALNFFLFMEKICSGEFEFTIEAMDLLSKSRFNWLKLSNTNGEVDELIAEAEAVVLLEMRNIVEFRKLVTGKGYLTPIELPDKRGYRYFIKKHVLWIKEVREVQNEQ